MTSADVDVDVLKRLSAKVVIQYEDLLEKFTDNEKKYEDLVKKYEEKEKQLQEMQKLIQPAVSEYEQIKMKYDMEVDMRTEAESYASEIIQENKNLKRQSSMLLSKIPADFDIASLNLDDETDKSDRDSYKDYTNKLNSTIRELENKVAQLTCSLKQTEEDLTIERQRSERLHTEYTMAQTKLVMTEKSLTQYKDAIEELSKVSEAAYSEFAILQEKYMLANKRRSDIEEEMSKIKIQNEAIKKQSTILLSNAASNMQLAMALNEVESLTTQLKEEKASYEKQINELQQKMEEYTSNEKMDEMSNENDRLKSEKDDLSEKLNQYEEQYKDLEKQYKELEGKYQDATRPPPPPPPPPPPSIQKSKGFLSNIKTTPKTEEKAAKSAPQGYGKALEEMMSRINQGAPLLNKMSRIGRRPSDTSDTKSSAMQELNGILGKFKRNMSVSDTGDVTKGSESELDKIFKKRHIAPENGSPETVNKPVHKPPENGSPETVNKPAHKPPRTAPGTAPLPPPGTAPVIAPKPFKTTVNVKSATLPPKLGNIKQLYAVDEERGSQVLQQDSTESQPEDVFATDF